MFMALIRMFSVDTFFICRKKTGSANSFGNLSTIRAEFKPADTHPDANFLIKNNTNSINLYSFHFFINFYYCIETLII